MRATEQLRTNLYASIGEQLVHYEVDVAQAALVGRDTVTLPANVQYAWPHPSRRYLYVASSDRERGGLGEQHRLTIFRIGDSGALEQIGSALPLPYRPIHVTVDGSGRWLAIAFNNAGSKRGPGTVLLSRLQHDGASVEALESDEEIDAGIYPHQTRFTVDDKTLLVCARGNRATAERAEELGDLKSFRIDQSVLVLAANVRYESGL
ncbi:MAG: lactonase family protein, partial [Gammaproteobacteria bacterium]|nr:lactonase family protein [Gammaproteobacteria bacterium]